MFSNFSMTIFNPGFRSRATNTQQADIKLPQKIYYYVGNRNNYFVTK